MKLDLGCGLKCAEGYEGVDFRQYNDKVRHVVDLNVGKLPFADESVEEVRSEHAMEHLSDPMSLVQEVHRVLKPGGKLTIIVPYFAHSSAYKPDHRVFWNLACHDYFDGTSHQYKKWDKVFFGHKWIQGWWWRPLEIFFDFLIRVSPLSYERRFARLFPFLELHIKLVK